MGWFWSSKSEDAPAQDAAKFPVNHGKGDVPPPAPAVCPVNHGKAAVPPPAPAVCPVNHGKGAVPPPTPAVCPVKHGKDTEVINPLNNMPEFISSERAPGQQVDLPTERIVSIIPRGYSEAEGFWEYPSPQQMYNAMLRKGKGDGIPEDAVVSMVGVHNFLNDGAWDEIMEWEQPYMDKYNVSPRLAKFTGRPSDLSPRARMYLALGKIFPNTFLTEPPFDRHDWFVLRPNGQGGWDNVRYVIDYYGGADDHHGMPTFHMDVRPALDSVTSVKDRFVHWTAPYVAELFKGAEK